MDRPGDPKITTDGIISYTVESDFQAGLNEIQVLLPDKADPNPRYRVVYCLPVNTGIGGTWGNILLHVRDLDLQNKHQLAFVAMAFNMVPWYGDHPTNPKIRQESYLLKVVLPLIESHHSVQKEATGRLLLGFSKSGWGAFSLLLRHPGVFGRAAAWDAPLQIAEPVKYEMDRVFATQENFEKYRVSELLKQQASVLRGGPERLALLGYGKFRAQMEQTHQAMASLSIPHFYANDESRPHNWSSGWAAEAVKFLAHPSKS